MMHRTTAASCSLGPALRRTTCRALPLVVCASVAAASGHECLVEPWQSVEIRSPVEGLISRITVQRGDHVKKGQLLVELKSDAERSAADSAGYRSRMEGRIASARHRLEYANRKLQRSADLHAQDFLAAQSRDDADAEKRLAEADLKDATENQELARIEHRRALDLLSLRSLHSPLDGVVVDRMLNVGDIAEAGTGRKPILKVAQLDPLRVEVALPWEMHGRLRVGMAGQVHLEGLGDKVSARISVIDKVFDAASGTFGVRLELPNPGWRLPGGLRCRVEFGQPTRPPIVGTGQDRTGVR